MSKISCRNIKHDFKEIILFCLNRNCKQIKACIKCFEQSHINHIHDCFQFNEMEFILSNEVYKIRKLTTIQNQKIQTHIEHYDKQLNQALSIYQQFRPYQQQIEFIINLTKLCYNNTIYNQLNSFILQSLIGQSNEKSKDILNIFNKIYSQNSMEFICKRLEQKGNRLLELKQLKETITFYKQAYQLNYNEENFIINYCRCLKLNKNILEAIKLMNNHRQIFNQNHLLRDLDLDFQNYLEKDSEFRMYHCLEKPYTFNYIIECANILLNMHFYDLCHQYIDYLLQKDPQNETAVIIKGYQQIFLIVDALLKEHKFGLAKQFVDLGEQKYPKIYRIEKYMCLMNDQIYFNSYKQTLSNQVNKNNTKTQITEYIYYSQTIFNDQINNLPQQSSVIPTQSSIQHQILQQQTGCKYGLYHSIVKQNTKNIKQQGSQIFLKQNSIKFQCWMNIIKRIITKFLIYQINYYLLYRCIVYCMLRKGKFILIYKIMVLIQNLLKQQCIQILWNQNNFLFLKHSLYVLKNIIDILFNGEKALKIIEQSNDKNDQKILKLRGKIYYEISQYPQALKCFEQLLELQQDDNETIRAIIQLIKKQNNGIQNSDDEQKSYYKKNINQSQFESKSNSEISKKSNQISEINATEHMKIGLEFDIGEILNMIPKLEIVMLYSI